MDSSLMSIILNPVRMRIIQSLIRNEVMTVQLIAQELPEVPQATLYRHLKKLLEAEVIKVVKENKVRGMVEKEYALAQNPYNVLTKELDAGNKNEILNVYYNFLMTLLGDFERYIKKEDSDLVKDGVTFRSAAMYLSDEEYMEFLLDMKKAFDKVRDNGPSPERRLRKISTIIMPSVDD